MHSVTMEDNYCFFLCQQNLHQQKGKKKIWQSIPREKPWMSSPIFKKRYLYHVFVLDGYTSKAICLVLLNALYQTDKSFLDTVKKPSFWNDLIASISLIILWLRFQKSQNTLPCVLWKLHDGVECPPCHSAHSHLHQPKQQDQKTSERPSNKNYIVIPSHWGGKGRTER